jgi:hypothetical protein
MLPSACSFTFSYRCSTLHVSAYMAIFKCVRFTFIFLKESAFVAFVARGYAMQFLICVFFVFSLVS